MFSGHVPFTNFPTKGKSTIPMVRMIIPIIRYNFRYRFKSAHNVTSSSSATGLYIAYTIAFPMPNSASDKKLSKEVKRLFNPRYSTPSMYNKIVRIIKGHKVATIRNIIPQKIFLVAFLVLCIFNFSTPVQMFLYNSTLAIRGSKQQQGRKQTTRTPLAR